MKVTTKFLEDNPDFLKQFEEDQRKIDALESYDYIQWLEKSPSSAIENYNQWLVFKNRKPRKFNVVIKNLSKIIKHPFVMGCSYFLIFSGALLLLFPGLPIYFFGVSFICFFNYKSSI